MRAVWTRMMYSVAIVGVAVLAITPSRLHASGDVGANVTFTPGVLPDKWLTGGPDCSELPQDFQIHKYNDNLYILREAGCVHHEKPFLFMLFGQQKVLLLDTGAGPNTDPETGREPNVRANVDFV